MAALLEVDFRDGFHIQCLSSTVAGVFRNLASVLLRLEVVTSKLAKEVAIGFGAQERDGDGIDPDILKFCTHYLTRHSVGCANVEPGL